MMKTLPQHCLLLFSASEHSWVRKQSWGLWRSLCGHENEGWTFAVKPLQTFKSMELLNSTQNPPSLHIESLLLQPLAVRHCYTNKVPPKQNQTPGFDKTWLHALGQIHKHQILLQSTRVLRAANPISFAYGAGLWNYIKGSSDATVEIWLLAAVNGAHKSLSFSIWILFVIVHKSRGKISLYFGFLLTFAYSFNSNIWREMYFNAQRPCVLGSDKNRVSEICL